MALLFALASTSAAARCGYDRDSGEVRDIPEIEVALAFLLVLALISYPLKDWADENPTLATVAVFGVPLIVGIVSSGGQC